MHGIDGRVGPRPRRRRQGPVGLVGRGEGRVLVVARALVQGGGRNGGRSLSRPRSVALRWRGPDDRVRLGGTGGGGGGGDGGDGGARLPNRLIFLRLIVPPDLLLDERESPPPRAYDALVHVPRRVVVHAGEVGLLGVSAPGGGLALDARVDVRRPHGGYGQLLTRPAASSRGLLGVGSRPMKRWVVPIAVAGGVDVRARGLASSQRGIGGRGSWERQQGRGGGVSSSSFGSSSGRCGSRGIPGGRRHPRLSGGTIDSAAVDDDGGPRRRESEESHVAQQCVGGAVWGGGCRRRCMPRLWMAMMRVDVGRMVESRLGGVGKAHERNDGGYARRGYRE